MPRVFFDPSRLSGDVLTLDGPDVHHLVRVLRLGPGDALTALDGAGAAYDAVVESASKDTLVARVTARRELPVPPLAVTLYQALPKADKLEWIIQKATELGVSRIVPVAAERSVVKLAGDRAEGKLARWQKIAQEAAEQSERGTVPVVAAPVEWKRLERVEGPALVLSERHQGRTLLQALPEAPGSLALFVGPEGGWAPAELDRLEALGVLPVTLGPRILRTETAGLAAIAIAMAHFELR